MSESARADLNTLSTLSRADLETHWITTDLKLMPKLSKWGWVVAWFKGESKSIREKINAEAVSDTIAKLVQKNDLWFGFGTSHTASMDRLRNTLLYSGLFTRFSSAWTQIGLTHPDLETLPGAYADTRRLNIRGFGRSHLGRLIDDFGAEKVAAALRLHPEIRQGEIEPRKAASELKLILSNPFALFNQKVIAHLRLYYPEATEAHWQSLKPKEQREIWLGKRNLQGLAAENLRMDILNGDDDLTVIPFAWTLKPEEIDEW